MHYLITALVQLATPISSSQIKLREKGAHSGEVKGYFINIGLTAETQEIAKHLVETCIQDGEVDWSSTDWKKINEGDLDQTIMENARNPWEPGVWYKSGRIFFGKD
jgi:hypothetical protein